jgi:phosphohistidine phosphatase SixA
MFPLAGILAFACSIQVSAEPDARLVNLLRSGGNVLVMRHGATRADQKDTNPHDPSDWAHQRQLSEEGRATARAMGAALHALNIPIDDVLTSEFLRAIETGTLLGFGEVSTSEILTEGHMGMASTEDRHRGAELRKLVATKPAGGGNVVFVTHRPNVIDAFGQQLADMGEGETAVFRPDGKGGYTLLERVRSDDWPQLAKAK